MSTNIKNTPAQTIDATQNKPSEADVQKDLKTANTEINSCYSELLTYSKPSMENICSIWNYGNNTFKTDGDNFYKEHMTNCDEYGYAAKSFGDKTSKSDVTKEIIANALNSLKEATKNAVAGLKALIIKETNFIKTNMEVDKEKTDQTKQSQEPQLSQTSQWNQTIAGFSNQNNGNPIFSILSNTFANLFGRILG